MRKRIDPATTQLASFIKIAAGVDEAVIRMITETNPIRAFGFKSKL